MRYGMNLFLWTDLLSEEIRPLLEDIKKMGFDAVEIPVFETDVRKYTAMGKILDEIGLARTGCTVRGPAVIGAGCELSDAFIGPYTAIYHDVTIDHAEVEHSIILANSRISGLKARLCDSLIGNDVTICHADGRPLAYRFMVGDSSRIGVV